MRGCKNRKPIKHHISFICYYVTDISSELTYKLSHTILHMTTWLITKLTIIELKIVSHADVFQMRHETLTLNLKTYFFNFKAIFCERILYH